MKRLLYLIVTVILLSFTSSCSHAKSYEGKPIGYIQNYSTYDEMLEDYKKLNPNYNEIYLDPLEELNPTSYQIYGICNCKHKSDNSNKNNIFRCPNFIEVYPGISFNDKYGNSCSLSCLNDIENFDIDDLKTSYYNDDLKINMSDINPVKCSIPYYICSNDTPIFSISIEDEEVVELLKQNLINHYSL